MHKYLKIKKGEAETCETCPVCSNRLAGLVEGSYLTKGGGRGYRKPRSQHKQG